MFKKKRYQLKVNACVGESEYVESYVQVNTKCTASCRFLQLFCICIYKYNIVKATLYICMYICM